MLGKDVCEILAESNVTITVPNLYQKLCDWGYLSRKTKTGVHECKHSTLHDGISIVVDSGCPYERPDFSREVVDEIVNRFVSSHQKISYSDRDMEVIRKIIDDESITLTTHDSSVLKYLRGDFRQYFNTSIHHYYLKSNRWAGKRLKTFEICGEKCYKCGSVLSLNVHHLTYMNWLDELAEELIPLCTPCHQWIHDAWDRIPNFSPYQKRFTDCLRRIKREIKKLNISAQMDDLIDTLIQ